MKKKHLLQLVTRLVASLRPESLTEEVRAILTQIAQDRFENTVVPTNSAAVAASQFLNASPIPASTSLSVQAPSPIVGKELDLRTPVSEIVTVRDWMEVYEKIVYGRGYNARTLKNKASLHNHIRRLLGDEPVATMRPYQIHAAIKTFPDTRKSTAARTLSTLRDVFTEAVAYGILDTNPALPLKAPTASVTRQRLDMDTWKAMFEHSKQHAQKWVPAMLLLAILTAQRRADLAKMKFSDVHDGFLYVEQQKQAGKGYGARVAIPITLSLPGVPMSLQQVIDACHKYAVDGETMLRKENGQPLELSSLSIRFHECLLAVVPGDKYGKREHPSLHEVRSLSARLYRQTGLDVQGLLGHKHPEMTAKYEDTRGLDAKEWKFIGAQSVSKAVKVPPTDTPKKPIIQATAISAKKIVRVRKTPASTELSHT